MARIGLYSSLVIAAFGIVIPFSIFKLGRLIGFAALFALAFLVGLGYGAVKAGNPWDDQGSVGNAMFMAASVVGWVVYVALSYGAASFIDRTASSLRKS